MTDYKLVPVEPTPEMLEAGADWCGQGLSTDEAKGRAVTAYKAMLAAAPDHIADTRKMVASDVQGEPVGWQFYQDGKWWGGDDRIKDHRKNTEEAGYPIRDVYVSATYTPKQQPSPDVEGLVEALEKARDAIASLPKDALGNVPDTQQRQGWHIRDELVNEISVALAAYRKQGGEV